MKLKEFLDVCSTLNAQLTIKDSTGKEIVSMKATGYESLDSSIEEADIKSWSVYNPIPSIGVILETPEDTTEP